MVKKYRLTKLELAVLEQATKTSENKNIAKNLYMSLGTVKAHLSSAYSKLTARNKLEAVLKCIKLGYIKL